MLTNRDFRNLLIVRLSLCGAGLCLALFAEGADQPQPRAIAAPRDQMTAARSPLPTQVSWGRGPFADQFLVFENGTGCLTGLNPGTLQLTPRQPVDSKGIDFFNATAPNGKWSAAIHPQNSAVLIRRPDVEDAARVRQSIGVDSNPQALAITPDSKTVLVACDSTGPADRQVCVVDAETGRMSCRGIPGSSNLRGIAVDPRGKFALAVHLVHKSHLPSTQIEQGWVFTNALTWLSLDGPEIVVTVPLDLRTQAFANPEGVAIAPDGLKAFVTHAGADLVSLIDLKVLRDVVNELTSGAGAPGAYQSTDFRLTRRYVTRRIAVGANPRGIAISADGKYVAVANRLDDSISLIDTRTDAVTATISLLRSGEKPLADRDALIRQGERLFHSGALSFAGQFSCASCHPDGHTDGLNWDLPADGFNNFLNTKSLRGNAYTAPYGWQGTSATLRDRFTGTLRHLFQHEPTATEAGALEAYLVMLEHPAQNDKPSSERAAGIARGRELFVGAAGCATCHAGEKFTDRGLHDVGTDPSGQTFDTPTLLGIATAPPYLHDGRAPTLAAVFGEFNAAGLHGQARDLTAGQLADLMLFLKSL